MNPNSIAVNYPVSRKIWFSMLILLAMHWSCRKSDYLADLPANPYTDRGQGTGTVTWTRNKSHLIEGKVFVNDGQTLTIEAGTVVRFREGQGEDASALIVARGGRIIINGSPEEPVIFTAELDDLKGSVDKNARGLWGGLILLGNAPVNLKGGEGFIEGIPFYESRGYFGGPNPNDNSGVLRYLSIRHGGTHIGEGNEINGLTLAGVGRGTEISHVEVFSNADDGIEIFGGTVNLRHIVVSGCGDDAIDYDLGWSGYGQFWLVVQNNYLGDNLVEGSGGINPVDGLPHSVPVIYNSTYIGNGNTGAGYCVKFDRHAGGIFANSLFLNNMNGISVETSGNGIDAFQQFKNRKLGFSNNVFYQVGDPASFNIFRLSGIYTPAQLNEWQSHFQEGNNRSFDPLVDFRNRNFTPDQIIRPGSDDPPSAWFQKTGYTGAFGNVNWLENWCYLYKANP